MTDTYHWIIKSEKRKAIWKQPFTFLEAARHEFETQMRGLSPEQREKTDWKLEMRKNQFRPKDKLRSKAEQSVIDEFEKI